MPGLLSRQGPRRDHAWPLERVGGEAGLRAACGEPAQRFGPASPNAHCKKGESRSQNLWQKVLAPQETHGPATDGRALRRPALRNFRCRLLRSAASCPGLDRAGPRGQSAWPAAAGWRKTSAGRPTRHSSAPFGVNAAYRPRRAAGVRSAPSCRRRSGVRPQFGAAVAPCPPAAPVRRASSRPCRIRAPARQPLQKTRTD